VKTVVTLFLFITTSFAQEKDKTIEWEKLQAGPLSGPLPGKTTPGTRIRVTLRNGNTLRGVVVHPDYLKLLDAKKWKPKSYDFSKAESVLLDISIEQPQLGGYVCLKRSNIRFPILELNPVDEARLEQIRKEQERIKLAQAEALEQYEMKKEEQDKEDEELKKRAENDLKEDPIEAKKKELDKIKEAMAVYDRFPEGSVEDQQAGKAWGAERIKLIQNKTRGLAPLSLEEQDFLTNIELWVLGKKYREEEKKEEEKKEP
jgi:hypothetical protein